MQKSCLLGLMSELRVAACTLTISGFLFHGAVVRRLWLIYFVRVDFLFDLIIFLQAARQVSFQDAGRESTTSSRAYFASSH